MRFETSAGIAGVKIEKYSTNNGVFTSQQFMESLLDNSQQIRFSGAGAAHQNGVAERGIKTIVNMARTMLIHATMHSPEGHITSKL